MKNILFLLLLLSSCANTDLLISTTSQKWTGGLKESGSGINYELILIAPESDVLFSLENICIDNKLYLGQINKTKFNKGDTIKIASRKTLKTCSQQNSLTYLINNEQKTLDIDSIKVLEKLFYH